MVQWRALTGLRLLAVFASIIYLAWLSWARWADPLIDFGQQLYLPWQTARGQLLYRDLAYYNGPLSVWANALAFRLAGPGAWTLIGCNALILLAIILLLHRLFHRSAGSWSAALAVLVFVWLFAFGKYIDNSNYNYLCPYNHELVHGLCLALGVLVALEPGTMLSRGRAATAGFLLGLILLTKAEISLAAIGAAGALWIFRVAGQPPGQRAMLARQLGLFLLCTALPVIVTFCYLASYLPPKQAWTGTIGSWAVAMNADVRQLFFYRFGLGTTQLDVSLRRMAVGGLVYGLFLLINVGAAYALRKISPPGRWAALVAIGVAFLAALAGQFPILDVFQPLPLVLLGLFGWQIVARQRAKDISTRLIVEQRLVLVIFAGLLLLKMAFATRIVHYGFVLAMPAVLVTCAAFACWIPAALSARGLAGECLAGSSLILIVFCIVLGQAVQHTYYSRPATAFGAGRDYLLSESPKAAAVAGMADALRTMTAPGERVVVFPEGAMLNYLARRESSIKYTNFMPPEVVFFGEPEMLAALKHQPPEWVVIAPKDLMVDYQVRLGEGFLDDMVRWIDEHYVDVLQVQAANGYRMTLKKRR